MSIFNKPGERPATRLDAPPAEGSMSVVGAGMRIVGDVESNGIIKVEGTIEGAVRGARQVLLGRSGVIQGDVHANDVVVGGKIIGNVMATERVEIQGTASVQGDLSTRSIVVFEGGMINGAVRMGDQARPAAANAHPQIRLAADN
jgi:cytoskeletal protein CcmA (bactofilin family)